MGMLNLAKGYRDRGIAADHEVQEQKQRELGTGYFDAAAIAVTGGAASTIAMGASTETAQFKKPAAEAAE